MTEPQRIANLFEDLYDGTPWVDANISSTLKELSWRQAAARVMPGMNSVWEIVNHLISWREQFLKRVSGKKVELPEDNFFSPITNFSPANWDETQKRYEKSQEQLLKYIKKLKASNLQKTYADSTKTFYYVIMGLLQHDAYHLGQIRMLRRLIRQ